MKHLTILLAASSLAVHTLAQVPPPSWFPFLPASHLEFSACITNGTGTASGFVMQASNSVYLVTARHVLFNPEVNNATNYTLKNTNSPLICSTYFVETPSTNHTRQWTIDAYFALARGEIKYLTNHDVCLIRFQDCNPINKHITTSLEWVKWITSGGLFQFEEYFFQRMTNVEIGADCYGVGFPSVLGLLNSNALDLSQPLLRKGIIAGTNGQRGVIIADCPVYKGNSGGMVITRSIGLGQASGGGIVPVTRWYIIGIQTEFIPVLTKIEENPSMGYKSIGYDNSYYSLVEPMDGILDLVWK
jgi:hypothetical protein